MPRYKAVIFDLDGTLCYTLDDLAISMNTMLGILGHKKNTTEELLQNINHGARTFVLKSLPEGIEDASPNLKPLSRCMTRFIIFTAPTMSGFTTAWRRRFSVLKTRE